DLFPALDVERKRDQDFENKVRKAAIDLHLQAEEASPTVQNNFVLNNRASVNPADTRFNSAK
ncbi:unnamed protein product, partial [Rotaria sordida]